MSVGFSGYHEMPETERIKQQIFVFRRPGLEAGEPQIKVLADLVSGEDLFVAYKQPLS